MLLFALTIGADRAQLRSGCSPGDVVVATLPAGSPVDLQFSLNDGTDCYKVLADVEGRGVQGYVPRSALAGLDGFERARRSAPDGSAVKLIEVHPSAQALALHEQGVKTKPKGSPEALALAGIAARLDLREAAGDRSTQKLYGMRVLLRYEDGFPRDAAASIVAVLDEEVTRVSLLLGCAAEERLVAAMQSRPAYLKSTDAAEWSAFQFNGQIRVALPEAGRFGSDTRRALAHEVVHACLANVPGPWPAWFHEGLAQKLSGDVLSASALQRLRQMAAAGAIPRLENIGQSWSRMSAGHARLSYQIALAAVDMIFESYPGNGIRNLLNNPTQLAAITGDLNRRLGL